MKTTQDLIQIVSYGGGVVIDSSKTTQDLIQIASYAAGKGSRVIIKGAGNKTTQDLIQIASYGKGTIIFDFTE